MNGLTRCKTHPTSKSLVPCLPTSQSGTFLLDFLFRIF